MVPGFGKEFCQSFFDAASEMTVEEVVEILKEEDFSTPEYPNPKLSWAHGSEQLRLKLVFEKFYPRVTIDHQCRAFQVINSSPCELGTNQGIETVFTLLLQ